MYIKKEFEIVFSLISLLFLIGVVFQFAGAKKVWEERKQTKEKGKSYAGGKNVPLIFRIPALIVTPSFYLLVIHCVLVMILKF